MLWPLATILLAVVGIDLFIEQTTSNTAKKARPFQERPGLYLPLAVICFLVGILWATAFLVPPEFRSISIRNLIIPTGIAALWIVAINGDKLFRSPTIVSHLNSLRLNTQSLLLTILLLTSIYELIAFSHKTMTYTEKEFIFPTTPVIKKLQQLSADYSRFASTPGSTIESNFATYYGLYDLSGYDALYPRRVGELVWAAQNNGQPVADFSRSTVVTPTNPSSARDNLWNLAGVRWILNKDDLLAEHPGKRSNDLSTDFKLIWEEGKWQIYENINAFPRAFFTTEETLSSPPPSSAITPAKITTYQSTLVKIEVDAPTDGYLILTDTFYPGWQATLDGQKTQILPALHAFRSVQVPSGKHTLEFNYRSL